MPVSSGLNQFDYLFQISPIILSGGIAAQLPGGQLSIASFLQAPSFGPVTAPGVGNDLDDFFAHFVPLPGSSLIDDDIGEYPFANQATAANAIITKPLTISYKMIAPATGTTPFQAKQSLMIALQQTLTQHNLSGGLYSCATPAFLWDSCVMRGMRDVTPEGQLTQRQVIWQLDFEQPLVTQQQAQQAQNVLLSKISNGLPVTPDGTGAIATSGPQAANGPPSVVTPPAQSSSAGNYQNTGATVV